MAWVPLPYSREGWLAPCGGLVLSPARDFSRFSTKDSPAQVSRCGRFQKVSALTPRGAGSSCWWSRRKTPRAPHSSTLPSSSEFAKCSSKAIDALHRAFPHFLPNKRIPDELVYSQIATSVNDPPSLVLPVTQMAVDEDLASCSKCQGCQRAELFDQKKKRTGSY